MGRCATTDELLAYKWMGRRYRAHLRVNHSSGEWSRRDPLMVICAYTEHRRTMS